MWAQCPQTSQTHSSPGSCPQDGSGSSDLGPGDPAGLPADCIWQPLSKGSCWPCGGWQHLELMAGVPGGEGGAGPGEPS